MADRLSPGTYAWLALSVDLFEPADNVSVCFAGAYDATDFPTELLTLSRNTRPGEDVAGVDGVFLEWNDQGNSGWGCIARAELQRARLRLVFTQDTHLKPLAGGSPFIREEVARLEDVVALIITFNIDDQPFARLRQMLIEVIFRGCECFHDES